MEGALAERRRVRELHDTLHTRCSELRSGARTRADAFFSNRKLSRTVRAMLAAGRLDDARAACVAQVEPAVARLAGDAEYRAGEYHAALCVVVVGWGVGG